MKRYAVDIVFPVFHGNLDEIRPNVERLCLHLESVGLHDRGYDWSVVLGINGPGAERVIQLAEKMAQESPRIRHEYIPNPGKGYGVMVPWMSSKADILAYMDIDLATDISSIFELLEPLTEKGGYDLSIGSRYHPKSVSNRKLRRRIVSIVYHKLFMKLFFGNQTFTDGQCGFKAIRRKAASELLHMVGNRNWFFESELLFHAERQGYRIKEIPVRWKESEHSGLSLGRAILEFLKCGSKLMLSHRGIKWSGVKPIERGSEP